MQSKQVIFVIHTLAIGGAERQISAVANYMAQQGIDVQILLIDNAKVLFELDTRVRAVCVNQGIWQVPEENISSCELFRMTKKPTIGFRISRMGEKLLLHWNRLTNRQKLAVREQEQFFLLQYALPLRAYLSQFPQATVISCMTIPNIATMMALQTLPNRAVFGDRTSPAFEYPPDSPFQALKRQYYPRAQAAVFQTPEAREYYTWLPRVEKVLIPNFIKGDQFPLRYEGERRKEIVNFCRLHPVKNIPLLINAFERLLKEYPAYTLSIYGEGAIRTELEEMIRQKGLSDSIGMYDFDVRIHEKVRDAAMFVSSSDREGISNSMLEAMAIGLPTICTDCPAGGARITITPYENGLLVPVGDEIALYRAMKELIEHPALAEKLSRNAVKIKDNLTIDIIGNKWMNII